MKDDCYFIPMETQKPEEHPVISDKTPNFSCWVAQTLMFKNRSRQQPLTPAARKEVSMLKGGVRWGCVCVLDLNSDQENAN